MKIEDLIQLLKNRLNTFKLSRDYARMNGDLERVNTADVEITTLEDTLYKLSLLVDASTVAVTEKTNLTDVMAGDAANILSKYDISTYATDALHEEKIAKIIETIGTMNSTADIDEYIRNKSVDSPITGEMILNAVNTYAVDMKLLMALMELDSRFGTVGLAVSTLNPGNVGNDDAGNTRTYATWQDGVNAVAEWLSKHRVTQDTTNVTATSTQSTMASTATSTVPFTFNASTTPPISQSVSTTTDQVATSTSSVATSTDQVATSTLPTTIGTSTPPFISPSATSTDPVATSTQSTSEVSTATTTIETNGTTTPASTTSSEPTSTEPIISPEVVPTPETTATSTQAMSSSSKKFN